MSREGTPLVQSAHEAWKRRVGLAFDQTGEAEQMLRKRPHEVLRFPWPDLDALTGPIGVGGELWFLVAVSGSGKTTFVTSLIERLRLAGRKIYVMPLETSGKKFRATLACMALAELEDPAERLVINPGDVNSGQYLSFPNVDEVRRKLNAAYKAQREAPYCDQVMVAEDGEVNVRRLEQCFAEAYAFGADLIIVDHIDHIDGGTGHVAAQSKAVCYRALQLAKLNDQRVLFTSQVNFDMLKGGDKLAKYQPPMIQHLKYPTTKVEVATGIIGLSRKIRARRPDEGIKEYQETLKAASKGLIEATEVLEPGVTQVNAVKLRNYGEREGQRILLGYEHGRLVPLPEKDRYASGLGGRMMRVV